MFEKMTTDTATMTQSAENLLIDPYDRHVSYLRVSVTDRCDFRCVYCMSENMTFLPKSDVLSLEELDRLCSAFVTRGVSNCGFRVVSRWSGATFCGCSNALDATSILARSKN